jgi:ribosomal protein L37AE/L43A
MEHNNSAIDPHCCVVHGYTKVMRTLAAGPASITIWECPKCATAPAANYVHTDLPLNTTVTVYNPSAERVKELEAENARILSTVSALTEERDALKAQHALAVEEAAAANSRKCNAEAALLPPSPETPNP